MKSVERREGKEYVSEKQVNRRTLKKLNWMKNDRGSEEIEIV